MLKNNSSSFDHLLADAFHPEEHGKFHACHPCRMQKRKNAKPWVCAREDQALHQGYSFWVRYHANVRLVVCAHKEGYIFILMQRPTYFRLRVCWCVGFCQETYAVGTKIWAVLFVVHFCFSVDALELGFLPVEVPFRASFPSLMIWAMRLTNFQPDFLCCDVSTRLLWRSAMNISVPWVAPLFSTSSVIALSVKGT